LENIIKKSNIAAEVIKVKIASQASAFDNNLSILQSVLKELKKDELKTHTPLEFSPLFHRNQFLSTLHFGYPIEIWADYAHHPTEVAQCIAHFEEKEKKNCPYFPTAPLHAHTTIRPRFCKSFCWEKLSLFACLLYQ
jgi:UDP-N-acetylmuramate-alanine ligase